MDGLQIRRCSIDVNSNSVIRGRSKSRRRWLLFTMSRKSAENRINYFICRCDFFGKLAAIHASLMMLVIEVV